MTRWLLVIPVLTVFATLLVGGHLYIAQRLVLDAGLPPAVSQAFQVGIALLAATIVLQPLGERFAPPRLARVVAWPASIWLGVAFWLLLALGATDLALWFGAAVASASGGQAPVASAPTGALRAALVGLGVGAVTLVA
ncbi:MAG: hypothetical protein MJE66_00435, partial [Proteobacteria bacterium]|nr:hypothetical protein [Pseudomonadota bacterium]